MCLSYIYSLLKVHSNIATDGRRLLLTRHQAVFACFRGNDSHFVCIIVICRPLIEVETSYQNHMIMWLVLTDKHWYAMEGCTGLSRKTWICLSREFCFM